MALEILFIVSGAGIVVLVYTKMRQIATKKDPFLLRVISLGDTHVRELSQRSAHFYADSKEDIDFFLRKQLPLHTKNMSNKSRAFLEAKAKLLADDLRGTRLFKKNGDISEFFKAMSEKENEASDAEADEIE